MEWICSFAHITCYFASAKPVSVGRQYMREMKLRKPKCVRHSARLARRGVFTPKSAQFEYRSCREWIARFVGKRRYAGYTLCIASFEWSTVVLFVKSVDLSTDKCMHP